MADNPKRPGLDVEGLAPSKSYSDSWKEIPLDGLWQAELPELITAWDELARRLWGMDLCELPSKWEECRQMDLAGMQLTSRRLAEHAERILGNGSALLQISGLLPGAQPTANEWDTAGVAVWRLKMRLGQPAMGSEATAAPPDGTEPQGNSPDPPGDLITPAQVAKLVHRAESTLRVYRKSWPSPDVPNSGRAPAKYSYGKLLPVLQRQFPNTKLPAKLPTVG